MQIYSETDAPMSVLDSQANPELVDLTLLP